MVTVLLLLLATLAMMMVMARTSAPLVTTDTPWGILHLELTFSHKCTLETLSHWKKNSAGADLIQIAKINTWLDYIFLIFYSLFFYYACRLSIPAGKLTGTTTTAHQVARAGLLAGLLDVVENLGMMISLYNKGNSIVSIVTAVAASAKWLLVILVILFLLFKFFKAFYHWIGTLMARGTLK